MSLRSITPIHFSQIEENLYAPSQHENIAYICLRLSVETSRKIRMECKYYSATHWCPIFSQSEYRVVSSANIRVIDCVLNDNLHIAIGCLHSTLAEYYPVLSGIQPAELCRLRIALSITNRAFWDPTSIEMVSYDGNGSPDASKARLKSRHSFVRSVRKVLDSLSEIGIHSRAPVNEHKMKHGVL